MGLSELVRHVVLHNRVDLVLVHLDTSLFHKLDKANSKVPGVQPELVLLYHIAVMMIVVVVDENDKATRRIECTNKA